MAVEKSTMRSGTRADVTVLFFCDAMKSLRREWGPRRRDQVSTDRMIWVLGAAEAAYRNLPPVEKRRRGPAAAGAGAEATR